MIFSAGIPAPPELRGLENAADCAAFLVFAGLGDERLAGEGKCSVPKPFTGLRFNLVVAVTSNNPQSRDRFSSFHSIESLFALLLSIDAFCFIFFNTKPDSKKPAAFFESLNPMRLRGFPPLPRQVRRGQTSTPPASFGLGAVSQPSAVSSSPQVGVQLVCARLLTAFLRRNNSQAGLQNATSHMAIILGWFSGTRQLNQHPARGHDSGHRGPR